MTFSDDDLKRLKEGFDFDPEIGHRPHAERLIALVARLECAEHVIIDFENDAPTTVIDECIARWRKSKGETE